MQVCGPKRGISKSVFLYDFWYPICISREAFADILCHLQVKVFLIEVYQKSIFCHKEDFIISFALREGSHTDLK